MFNLIRRRLSGKKRNNKNKYNVDIQQQQREQNDDNEPTCLVNKQEHESKTITTTTTNGEYYRQFIESDVKIQPTAVATAANVGSSITDRKTRKPKTNSTKQDDEEEKEDEEETGMNILLYENDGEAKTSRKKRKAINAGKIYFESFRKNKPHREKGENYKQQQQGEFSAKKTHNFKYRNNDDSNMSSAFVAATTTTSSTHTFGINENDCDQEREKLQQVQDEERHRQEQQVECVRSDREACGFSHNEQAEWQRRVLTIGEIEHLPNRINNNNNNNFNCNTKDITTKHYENNTLITNKNDVGNQINSNENGKKTTTPSTVNNEVKYRNLDKKKSRNEAKRQSRLSFTFTGISFNNKKREEDHVKTDKLLNDKITKSAGPAIQAETSQNLHNLKKSESGKLGPFQKSREFLNDLFMARGRHHNRHRHQQQQQSAHQTKQQGGESRKNTTLHGGGSGGGGGGGVIVNAVVGGGGGTESNINDQDAYINNNLLNDECKNGQNKSDDETRVSGSEGNMCEHLELNTDRASDSTNSYQIPSAKNSAKNFQTNASTKSTERERSRQRQTETLQIRSNSASYAREEHSPKMRSSSAHVCRWENNDVLLNTAEDVEKAEDKFIRTVYIDRYGGKSAKTANENSAEDNKIDGDTHGESAEAGVIPSSTTTASYEDTNHLIEESSLTTITQYTPNETNEISTSSGCSGSNNNNKIKLNKIDYLRNASTLTNMGQTNTKSSDASVNMSREFRESSVDNNNRSILDNKVQSVKSQPINVEVPTITVADYSGGVPCEQYSTPTENEIFYDFDKNDHTSKTSDDHHINIMEAKYDGESDIDGVFYNSAATSMPTTNDQYSNKWQTPNNGFLSQSQMRHSHVKLEDVREENEDEEEDRDNNKEESEEDEEEESENSENNNIEEKRHHLDNELYKSSSERSPLKSSDATLSGSPSDSGIGTDSQPETPMTLKNRNSPSFKMPEATTATYTQQLKQNLKQQYGYMSFVRDGNSTDCDENLLPCDDIDVDLAEDDGSNERLVCIESISLPDVVVESTTASSSSAALSSASSTTSGEHIININGASGNNVGNVHFIPIHIEGAKKRSVDDSCIGGGTIEITEDASVINGYGDSRTVEKLK